MQFAVRPHRGSLLSKGAIRRQLTDRTLTDKSFVKQSDANNTNTLAAEAADLVRKVKRHIEKDKCECCREALQS